MAGSRLTRQRQAFAPVAAEVLEVRSLLSAGAAAVHAAQHHAAAHVQTIEPHGFHGNVNAAISIAGGLPSDFPGNFSLSNVKDVVGAKVTASFSFSISQGGATLAAKGKFAGTIQKIVGVGNDQFITLTPTGGSITFSSKDGKDHSKATAFSDGSLLHLTLENGIFKELTATNLFPPNATPPLNNKTVSIDITTF
jgi:hypothetical protein